VKVLPKGLSVIKRQIRVFIETLQAVIQHLSISLLLLTYKHGKEPKGGAFKPARGFDLDHQLAQESLLIVDLASLTAELRHLNLLQDGFENRNHHLGSWLVRHLTSFHECGKKSFAQGCLL
jgi:hypothetical protein